MPSHSPPIRFNLTPVLWLAAAFASGIGLAHLFDIPLLTSVVLSVTCGILAGLLLRYSAATLLACAAFAAAGAVSYSTETLSIRPDRIKLLYDTGTIASGDPVEIEGVLIGRPEPSVEGQFLRLRTDRVRNRGTDRSVTGRVRLFVPFSDHAPASNLKHGSRVIVNCTLHREDEYLNPGVLRRPAFLDQIGIDASGSVKSPLLIEHVADESVFLPLAWVYDRRADLIDIFKSELSPEAAGVMIASLLGDKYFLDGDTAEIFREGGTFHVLVISGLHITFIGGILLLAIRWITRKRWGQFLVTAAVLWSYTLAVGAEVPVVRAAITFTVVLFSYVIFRPASMLNSLGICSLILLAWRPSDLFNPSFHLTFVSVAAIIAIAYPLIDAMRKIGSWSPSVQAPFPPMAAEHLRKFCEMLYWERDGWDFEVKRQVWSGSLFKAPYFDGRLRGPMQKLVRYIFEGIVVSLAVQICMLPLLVVYFHRISLVSIVLNLWVGFFIAIESIAAVVASFLTAISPLLAAPLFLLAEVFNSLMMLAPRLMTGNSWSGFRLPAYTGIGRAIYLLYFVVLIALAYAANKWWLARTSDKNRSGTVVVSLLAALALLILIIVFHPFSAPTSDGRLKIDFLDVGQGDAALVTFPDGQTMLVDGGGRMRFRRSDDGESEPFEPDIRRLGESVVSEFLWERGYSSIDYILATHSDTDHMQGLADVAGNFRIRKAVIGRMSVGDPDFEELRDVLTKREIETSFATAGDVWSIGGVDVEVLFPPDEDVGAGLSNNDGSIVLRISYGRRTFLLTGDIESLGEAALASSGTDLATDVVKVPHHGSRTSSTAQFVDATKPQIAVIPVGRRSRFGHPHPEVVNRWRKAAADVRTTGDKGMVSISTDGSDLQVSTFLP